MRSVSGRSRVAANPGGTEHVVNRLSQWVFLALITLLVLGATRAHANQPPVPNPQTVNTPEDEVAVPITLTASDQESDPITWAIYSAPANGTLTGTPPNVYYTPRPNFNGMDSFEFKVRDPFNSFQYATVTLTISPDNDPPTAENISLTTNQDTPASVLLLGDDVDADTLTFSISRPPTNGVVTGTPPNVLYTPRTGFRGSDSFTYTAKDGSVSSVPALVKVDVLGTNTPPRAVKDEVSTDINRSVTFNVLSNDSDDDGDPLTLTSSSAPSNGRVSCSASGKCAYDPAPNFVGSDAFTYAISDGNGGSATASVIVEMLQCPSAVHDMNPPNGSAGLANSSTLSWRGSNADSYTVYFGAQGSGCSKLLGTTKETFIGLGQVDANTSYEWKVVSNKTGCQAVESVCSRFTTRTNCTNAPPTLVSPEDAASGVTSPATFSWNAAPQAISYKVFASVNGAPAIELGASTTATSLRLEVPAGQIEWWVEVAFPNCSPVSSARRRLNVKPSCGAGGTPGTTPIASVIGEVTTGERYRVEWSAVPGSSSYEVQESTVDSFTGALSRVVIGTSTGYTHLTQGATPFFYRVRAIVECDDTRGSFSRTVRVVITPLPSSTGEDFDIVVSESSKDIIIQPIHIRVPAAAAKNASEANFTASSDKPWMTVTPSSGTIPPSGITIIVTADPAQLPVGSNTGTVIVKSSSGATIAAVPLSVSLVTPVAPVPKTSTPDNALIIPSVSHVEGVNSAWQSDIRMANTSGQTIRYQLSWTRTGTDGTKEGKQTGFSVPAGQTVALNDIVKQWYGLGSLNDGANGVLEIRPLNFSGKTAEAVLAYATVASSKTYNVTSKGTLGQFIPAIPFRQFTGRMNSFDRPAVLSLQHITQSAKFRTNFGIVEGSGQAASTVVSIFNSAGMKIDEFPIELRPGEQKQIDALLKARNLSVEEARIEVRVVSATGRVAAYASVVDNGTGDPLLVPAVELSELSADRYVIPGVADIDNGVNRWRSDLRLFNGSTTPLLATAEFYPQDQPENVVTKEIIIAPGEIRVIDDAVRSLFGLSNVTGAVHVKTLSMTSLVATARTFDQRPEGTFGQFVPAFTSKEGFASGDRPLQILQIEESDRFRTNVGIAEMTGNAVKVQIRAIVPNSTFAPVMTLDLKASEFKQLPVLKMLGLKGTYNGRITIEVLSGTGKIAAYASVIDNESQDPTYVPGQ